MLLMDHLPECPAPLCDYFDPKGKCMGYEDCEHLCCCAALRACERRVFQEQIVGRQHDMVLGYQRGLAAARRAVQVLPKGGMGLKAHALWRDALAAIDALREKP